MNARSIAAAILPLTMLISACSTADSAATAPKSTPVESASAANATTRTSEGGQVTVVVDWAGPAGGAVFNVTLDTHSVDLDGLDLSDAILRNDRGTSLPAEPWAAPKGGHHREGALTFAGDAAPFFGGATWIELVLAGIGDLPERTLRWEVAS